MLLFFAICFYLLGLAMGLIWCKLRKHLDIDGVVHIDTKTGEKDKYQWEFKTSLYDIRYKKQIVFKVDPDAIIREDNSDYNETY